MEKKKYQEFMLANDIEICFDEKLGHIVSMKDLRSGEQLKSNGFKAWTEDGQLIVSLSAPHIWRGKDDDRIEIALEEFYNEEVLRISDCKTLESVVIKYTNNVPSFVNLNNLATLQVFEEDHDRKQFCEFYEISQGFSSAIAKHRAYEEITQNELENQNIDMYVADALKALSQFRIITNNPKVKSEMGLMLKFIEEKVSSLVKIKNSELYLSSNILRKVEQELLLLKPKVEELEAARDELKLIIDELLIAKKDGSVKK